MILKKSLLIACSILILVCVFVIWQTDTLAASITNLSDKVSRHSPSVGSDHEVKFRLPSGLDNSGEFIRINFASNDFDLSSVTFADMDLTWGATGVENSVILNSSATATDFGVSVGASFIDFFHPTNNTVGDIAAGSVVIIKIGLNASGGVQQIINPATLGTKAVYISSSRGDTGALALVIANDQLTINSNVSGVYLNPPFNILSTSMDLSWSQYAGLGFVSYQIYYSTSPGVDNTDSLGGTFTNITDLTTTVADLTANTPYYFIIYVNGPNVYSNEVSATTSSGGGVIIYTPPADPIIDSQACPYFWTPAYLSGTMEQGSVININGSFNESEYPSSTSWRSLRDLVLYGSNIFNVYAWSNNLTSSVVTVAMKYWRVGDTNGNTLVDYYDLSNEAYYWMTPWCYGDFFNNDNLDYFDLSGMSFNWD